MKAGIWTYFYQAIRFEEKVRAYLDCGITCGELSDEDSFALLTRGKGEKVGSDMKKFLDAAGFSLPQGHLWLKVNLYGEDYKENAEILKNWLDMYLELGIKSAVLHPGRCLEGVDYITGMGRMGWSFRQLGEYLNGTDLSVCIENMRSNGGQYSTEFDNVENLVALMEQIDSPNFGITLDTGHLNLCGGDQYEFIMKAGNYLKAMHIADNQAIGIDEHMMPFGRGTVDWGKVMSGLRDIGYDRFLSFEIPGESRLPFEVGQMKLKYVKGIMDYMLAM